MDEAWDERRVLSLRQRLNLSQAEFAARIGVRQQTVSEWETGKYRPRGASARMLFLLAEDRAVYESGRDGDG